MPSCKQHTEKLTGEEIDCPFCEIQKCYIEINDLTEKLDEEIKIQNVIAGDANKLEEELEKSNNAYLGIKADYTSARQAFASKVKNLRADTELARDRAREAQRLRNEDYAALQKGIQAIDANHYLRDRVAELTDERNELFEHFSVDSAKQLRIKVNSRIAAREQELTEARKDSARLVDVISYVSGRLGPGHWVTEKFRAAIDEARGD